MHPAFFLTAVGAVYAAGWLVEETPLVSPPFEVEQVDVVDDRTLGVVGIIPGPPLDGGYPWDRPTPREWAVFAARPGKEPLLLLRSDAGIRELSGKGTGFTAGLESGTGTELLRIRVAPEPELVALGRFEDTVLAVSCDDAVSLCVVITEERGAQVWRADAGLGPLSGVPSGPPDAGSALFAGTEEAYGRDAIALEGVAVRPDGGFVALSVGGGLALLDLKTGAAVVQRTRDTWKRPSLAAFVKEVQPKGKLARAWANASEQCTTTPMGWSDGKLMVSQTSTTAEIDFNSCRYTGDWLLDPVTLKRTFAPPYFWEVLDCPAGGWTSKSGTFTTSCITEVQSMLREPPPRREGSEWAPHGTLPEAVALSETHIFVMAHPKKSKWTWWRGKSKQLEFILEGPSVIEFQPTGVLVEKLAGWRFGSAVFQVPMEDDWHLITSSKSRFERVTTRALVRIRPVD